MNFASQSPSEIDAVAFTAMQAKAAAERVIEINGRYLQGSFSEEIRQNFHSTYVDSAETCIERARNFLAGGESKPVKSYTRTEEVAREIAKIDEAEAAVFDQQEILDAVQAEFTARGGWTRAFLVTNVNGHVHSSMQCSTCRYTTQYHWVTSLSGHDEGEIVDAAGSDACTVCYPSAPLDRPRSIFTPDEEQAQKDRAERAAAKAEREAKKLAKALLPTGEKCMITDAHGSREDVTTLAAARKELTDAFQYQGFGYPRYAEWLAGGDAQMLAQAIADKEGKTVEVVLAEAAKRAAQRR